MERRAVRLIITGQVQGVGYRWWTVQTARRLGLDGWVRNRRDGSVEVVAIGSEAAADELAAACRRGPPAADVTAVAAAAVEDDGSVGFEALPTA